MCTVMEYYCCSSTASSNAASTITITFVGVIRLVLLYPRITTATVSTPGSTTYDGFWTQFTVVSMY